MIKLYNVLMILRNILFAFLILLINFDLSHSQRNQNHYILKDTASYIDENSYFYDKNQYKDIFIKSINAINSYSENILIKILKSENSNLELEIQGKNKTQKFGFYNKDINDVGTELSQLIDILQDQYELKNEDMKLDYLVANTMLQDVDEYSSIIHPDLFDEFLIESKGSFGGLGIVIGIRDERLTIISPIEGTPAEKAGVKANDKISRIENFETEGFTLEQAIKLLRGDKGTPITIYVERENVADLIEFKIIRDIIKIKSIESKAINSTTGYIKINSFQSNTYQQFISSLNKLRENGASSLILDLRGNPGGLFDQALRISNIFLKEKLIVSTKSKSKDMNINFFTNPTETPKFDGPLIVLIDGGSASASEIVTGAIKNNQRGIIIGQQTFGKGTVQEIYKQDDGSGIKLTIAEYLSPINYKVHLNGISPDIKFIPIKLKNIKLLTDKEIEDELSDGENKSIFNIIYTPKDLEENDLDELISFSSHILDFELLSKIQLRGNTSNFLTILENYITDEAKNISKSFTSKLKNFTADKRDTKNKIGKIKFKINNKDIKFKPGIDKEISGIIKNNTGTNLTNIIIKSESANKTFNNKYFYIGEIKNKKEIKFKIPFEIPSWIKRSEDIIKLSLMELDMSRSLKPSLSAIEEVSLKTKIIKRNFMFPKFTYNITPELLNDELNINLNIETIDVPVDCKKCYMKILSQDKKLIIKNKSHKLFENKEVKLNHVSKLSIPLVDIKNGEIKFTIRFQDENTQSLFDKNISIKKEEISTFKSNNNFYGTLKDTTTFSEPSENGIIVGEIKGDNVIKSIGESDNFILIESDNFISSWVKKSDLQEKKINSTKKSTYRIKKIYEGPPSILIDPEKRIKNKVNIKAEISDSSEIKNINYFLNDKKIKLNMESSKVINDAFQIELEPGRNKLYIIASDKKDIKTYKEIYLTRNEN